MALVTDGRLSGASGKVPAAIHLCPEALTDGPVHVVKNGDVIRLDGHQGTLDVISAGFSERLQQPRSAPDVSGSQSGNGRELFAGMRLLAGPAERGAISLGWE